VGKGGEKIFGGKVAPNFPNRPGHRVLAGQISVTLVGQNKKKGGREKMANPCVLRLGTIECQSVRVVGWQHKKHGKKKKNRLFSRERKPDRTTHAVDCLIRGRNRQRGPKPHLKESGETGARTQNILLFNAKQRKEEKKKGRNRENFR